MDEPGSSDIASTDSSALIASLRTAGAARFDPVRWHYLEVLAERARDQQGSIKRMLDAKLAQALATYKERFDHAHGDASEAVSRNVARHPQAADDLQRQLDAGDFKGLRQLIARLETGEAGSALSALVRQLGQHSPENPAVRLEENTGARAELKILRNFRNTWSKLSADKQVAHALGQAPANAGPINSHMLVLRSLALMRDISPDYLNRFMSYADTLLSLDQGGKKAPGTPKKSPVAKAAKK